MLKKLKIIAQNVLFPSYCVICKNQSPFAFPLCRKCLKTLPFIENACIRCALPLSNTKNTCGRCLKARPSFDKTLACFQYQSPIKELLHQFKIDDGLYLAPLFGRFIAHRIKTHYQDSALPESLLPMPAHPKRVRQRGYNPALEIAKYVSLYLSMPLDTQSVKRIHHTPPQTGLPYKERSKNVKGVFHAKPMKNKSIVILDDVMTTGASSESLAKTLKIKGAKNVTVWCLARTTPHLHN
jgi:ComF family protein